MASAISSGFAKCWMSTWLLIQSWVWRSCSADSPSRLRSALSTGPGLIAFTRTPRSTRSAESVLPG